MKKNQKQFSGLKATVMGLGLHGGGLSAANWLLSQGAKVVVTDLKNKEQLKFSLDKISKKEKRIKFVLGRHDENDFINSDLIVQNPGVPRESKYLNLAKEAGVVIENEASLFFKNCPSKIIGVTGTRGKSTTSTLVYLFLKSKKALLAGQPQNPMLGILNRIKSNNLAVLELSSWQLEVLGDQTLSPQVAIITNIYPDHLNRYSGMTEYIQAKTNIFLYQKPNDYCILNFDNSETKKIGQKVKSQLFWFSKKYFPKFNGTFAKNDYIYFRQNNRELKICSIKDIKLLGEHNLENVLAAICVAGIFKVNTGLLKKVLQTFIGLPSRIQLIREVSGVKYINDTTATTPDGTMAALKALKSKNIILLGGGDFKNIPDSKYEELAKIIKQTCKAVVLFSGKGSQQLIPFLKKNKFENLVTDINNMSDLISVGKSFAQKGDIVLLSPACASFNLFINEYDRGNQFNEIVKKFR